MLNSDFLRNRVFKGFICFLMLIALTMASISGFIVMIPAMFLAAVFIVLCVLEFKIGYISVALSVCKNE